MDGQSVFNKVIHVIQWRKESLFHKWSGTTNLTITAPHTHKNQYEMYCRPMFKNEYYKILEEIPGEKFFITFGLARIF